MGIAEFFWGGFIDCSFEHTRFWKKAREIAMTLTETLLHPLWVLSYGSQPTVDKIGGQRIFPAPIVGSVFIGKTGS
jgi:hypothetical protein